ncbi:hypothetical protein C8Q78DRAFT_969122 [Trametes maxima]|nr:hypothetical protein C8Q78DRAFT_969122 [Trametes maxima]
MDYGEQKYYADDHGVLVRYNPIGCPPEYLVRYPRPKRDLAEPIPGLSKPARGRAVPKAGNSSDPRRRHVCPVETCKKTFIKRDHLDRHIRSLHRHERGNDCHDSDCSFTSGRRDNMAAHERTHDYSQEIFLCSPEDNFKGLHLMNPQVAVSKAVDIKPFANIAIHPMALGLWVYEETERRKGFNLPIVKTSDIQRYFDAHPEEIESALRRDPKWEWRMPQAGPEFARVDDRCLVGKFKLKIKRDPEVEREGSA